MAPCRQPVACAPRFARQSSRRLKNVCRHLIMNHSSPRFVNKATTIEIFGKLRGIATEHFLDHRISGLMMVQYYPTSHHQMWMPPLWQSDSDSDSQRGPSESKTTARSPAGGRCSTLTGIIPKSPVVKKCQLEVGKLARRRPWYSDTRTQTQIVTEAHPSQKRRACRQWPGPLRRRAPWQGTLQSPQLSSYVNLNMASWPRADCGPQAGTPSLKVGIRLR